MARKNASIELLVLGDHPSAYLATAWALDQNIHAAHISLAQDRPADRIEPLHTNWFTLDDKLANAAKKIKARALHGIRFVGDDAKTAAEHREKSKLAYTAAFAAVRDFTRSLVPESALLPGTEQLEVLDIDESQITLRAGQRTLTPKALIIATIPPDDVARALGIPKPEPASAYVRSLVRLATGLEVGSKPAALLSLNLAGTGAWAFGLAHGSQTELSVLASGREDGTAVDLLRQWAALLHAHGLCDEEPKVDARSIRRVDAHLRGALAQENVANRTLLIGPAGGFVSDSGEELYPGCWSAKFAVEAMRDALKADHLQDALDAYRHSWRTELGEYLRGPRDNLRFLLPMVYRNPVMTTRLTEAILQGKAVVR